MTNHIVPERTIYSLDTPEPTAEQVVDMRQQALGILGLITGSETTINEWRLESRTRGQIGVSGAVLRKGNIRASNCQVAVCDFGNEGVLASFTKVYPQEASDYVITDRILLRNGLVSLGSRSSHELPRRSVDRAYFDAVRAKNALEAGSGDSSLLTADYAAFWERLFTEMNEELRPAEQQSGEGPRRQKFGILLGQLSHSPKTST